MYTVYVNKYSHAGSGVGREHNQHDSLVIARREADRLVAEYGYRFAYVTDSRRTVVHEALTRPSPDTY